MSVLMAERLAFGCQSNSGAFINGRFSSLGHPTRCLGRQLAARRFKRSDPTLASRSTRAPGRSGTANSFGVSVLGENEWDRESTAATAASIGNWFTVTVAASFALGTPTPEASI